jgi:type IV pilus assembly protein PilB
MAVVKRSGTSERVLHNVSEDFKLNIVKEQDNGEEVLSLESIDKDESPIVKLMHTTIFDAIQRRASDIHIESTDKNVLIKYRIDGVLYLATEPIDIKFHSAIVSRLKVMSDLDIAERRVPQDGRFKIRTGGKTIDFRVSILPSAFGEDVVIRILDKESITAGVNTLSLDSVGFDENDLRRFRKSIREPYGMVLVTGPTGSGKTTTLYAALTEINTGEDKFITIEDPVEYQLRGVTQIRSNTSFRGSRRSPSTRRRASPSPEACARSCGTTRTRSWSARSATPRPDRSRSSPRLRGTWSLPQCMPTTPSTCSAAS